MCIHIKGLVIVSMQGSPHTGWEWSTRLQSLFSSFFITAQEGKSAEMLRLMQFE